MKKQRNPEKGSVIQYPRWSAGSSIKESMSSVPSYEFVDRSKMDAYNASYDEAELNKLGSQVLNPPDTETPVLPDLSENVGKNRVTDGEGPIKKMTFADRVRSVKYEQINKSAHVDHGDILKEKAIERRNQKLTNSLANTSLKVAASNDELADDDINPIRLQMLLEQIWGEEWLDWEPETIIETAKKESVPLSISNMNKLFAIRNLLKTNQFFDDPRSFEKVSLAFAGRYVDWGITQKPRVHEMAAAVALVSRYLKEHPYSNEVLTYIAGVAVDEGFVFLPSDLMIAQEPFVIELLSVGGEDAAEMQNNIRMIMDGEISPADAPAEYSVQYIRLLKCQNYVQAVLNEVVQ